MFDQNAILDAKDVRRNPVHGLAEARKSPMYNHKIFFGHNRSRFILQRRRDALDEIELAIATRATPPSSSHLFATDETRFGCKDLRPRAA